MKKLLSSILILCFTAFVFAANTESSGYEEVTAAYNSGFFPGVVEKSVVFEKQYPDSIYLKNVKLMKGEALINMFRYEQAIDELSSIESKLGQNSLDLAKCSYFCGLAYFYSEQYDSALVKFYNACSISKEIKDFTYYVPAVLFAGRIYFIQNDFKNAEQPFEYVVQNGIGYSKADYDEAIQKLILSYNKNQNYKKAISLYSQLNKEDFSLEIFYTMTLYVAEAYEATGNFNKAYELYSSVVESGLEKLAVSALKKAYIVATENKLADPAEIFAKSEATFANSPALVCDFWTRLGIDDFNKAAYDSSAEYFAKAKEIENSFLVQLYEAKLAIQKNHNPEEAEKILLAIKLTDKDDSDSYYGTLVFAKALLSKWTEVSALYEKIQTPDVTSMYLTLAAYYNQGKFDEAVTFFEGLKLDIPDTENKNLFALYGSSLAKTGAYGKACGVYQQLNLQNLLDSESSMEYAKALFQCRNYSTAYNFALKSQDSQKDYLCGLCANNLKRWDDSLNHFIAYIKTQNGKEGFNKLAYFYKGYAEYRLEDWKNAYASFVRYGTEEKNNSGAYIRKAYEYSARAALQTGDYKNASIQAENVIKTSVDLKEKQEAILFCVEIYSNIENYDKAVSVLQPYTNEKSEFGADCLYQIAKIYEKTNQVSKADQSYTKICKDYEGTALAEKSMYNLGELYYSNQNYSVAEQKFNKYIYQFTKGKFLDAALFYCADCNLKLGNLDKSILLNKTLVNDYSKSIYLYGAYKNLLQAYYAVEDYLSGLKIARTIVEKYPSQAAIDEIGSKVLELERIVGGTDKKVSEKISEYEKLGKAETKAGRFAGTELVKYYAADSALKDEAYKLAKEIFKNQKDDDEAYCAAQNAEFIADYERQNQNNEEAGQMYLKAAQLYRKTTESKDTEVASVLYGAVEAFKAAGLMGDAEDTANLLVKLYPESNYAKNAKALVR